MDYWITMNECVTMCQDTAACEAPLIYCCCTSPDPGKITQNRPNLLKFSGGICPPSPPPGLRPWTPLGAVPPDPCCSSLGGASRHRVRGRPQSWARFACPPWDEYVTEALREDVERCGLPPCLILVYKGVTKQQDLEACRL